MTDRSSEPTDYDVVIVGGGPAGCAAGVFTARYGLETAVFDRGAAPLRRCAHLENYLGFPAGIDIDSFYDLIHAQVEQAGCDLVADTVDTVDRGDDTARFVVDPQDAASVTATVVVAATWYDGEYLRPLGGDDMFETHDHDGEEHEHFDPEYADADGRTPIEGLYVASPAGQRSTQAVIAAGHGAHVGRCVLADRRREEGYPDGVAEHYDWLRRDAEFSGEWNDRDRWRDWFDDEAGEDHGLPDERYERLRERYIDQAFETRVSETSAEERSRRGLGRLLETIGTERVLDAIDDETIEAYAQRRRPGETVTD